MSIIEVSEVWWSCWFHVVLHTIIRWLASASRAGGSRAEGEAEGRLRPRRSRLPVLLRVIASALCRPTIKAQALLRFRRKSCCGVVVQTRHRPAASAKTVRAELFFQLADRLLVCAGVPCTTASNVPHVAFHTDTMTSPPCPSCICRAHMIFISCLIAGCRARARLAWKLAPPAMPSKPKSTGASVSLAELKHSHLKHCLS